MKHVLIVIPQPQPDNEPEGPTAQWHALELHLKRSATTRTEVLCIAAGCFLFPFAHNVEFLAELVQGARKANLPLRLLLVEETPEWIEVPPKV